jgi:hypothetical protein
MVIHIKEGIMDVLTLELLPQAGDTGKYFVGNVIFKEQQYISPEKKFVLISPEVGFQIRETIGSGAEVLLTEEQIENSGDLKYEDFEIISHTDFEVEKRKTLFKLRNRMGYSSAIVSAMDLYGFYICYSTLLSRGYNITDENREEKYLDIINSEDEELLQLLEEFIEMKEKLDVATETYFTIKKYIKDVEETTTIEQLEEVKANIPFSV